METPIRLDPDDRLSDETPPEVLFARAKRRQRVRLALAIVPIIIALPLLIPDTLFYIGRMFNLSDAFVGSLRLTSVLMLMISGFGFLMIYLQTGFKKTTFSDVLTEQYENTQSRQSKEQATILNEIDRLKSELLDIKTRSVQPSAGQILTPDDHSQLVETLKQRLLTEEAQELVSQFRTRLEATISQDERRKIVTTIFGGTLQRLHLETNALARRGNTNLGIGIVTTLAGLFILGELVFRGTFNPKDPLDLSAHYIPRITLVIFIEVFAYFFLKLYKSSLSEIKYFQNEMTNVESKQVALAISLGEDNKTARSDIIKTLANTERNNVLKKGETTVELERVKLDKDALLDIIPKLLAPVTAKQK